MKKYLVSILLVASVGLVAWQLIPASRSIGQRQDWQELSRQQAANQRPNIILVYADDIDCESLFTTWPDQPVNKIRFPVLRSLAESGTVFTNFHVTTPVCGPSRACMLSGQYAHHNQIRVNTPEHHTANGFSGGYGSFDRQRELGIWMRQAGYRTAFVGKYLHDGFSPVEGESSTWQSILPRGWDEFLCVLGGNYKGFGFFGTHQQQFTRVTDQYRTDFEADRVCEMIEERLADQDQPFLLCWAPYAAHLSVEPEQMTADRHNLLFQDEIPLGILQADEYRGLTDQPSELAAIPDYPPEALERWAGVYQNRLRTIQALDEGLGRMLDSLKKTGQLDRTLIVFTSDHGFAMGQHRHFGKRFPYDRTTKVPFIVCGPGVPAGASCDQLLANIDIAPTLVALAGGVTPDAVDGVSFAALIRQPNQKLGRPGIILENWDRIWANGVHVEIAYCAWRTADHLYTEWASGSFEYYDVKQDPEQVHNLYPSLPDGERVALKNQLRQARQQSGQFPPVISKEFRVPAEYHERQVMAANFQPVAFSGFVEAESGIQRLDLELYCPKINSYWNGQAWSQDHATVPAELTMPAGHISQWSYLLDSSPIAFDRNERMNRRDVVVNLIATDMQENQARQENAYTFKLKINDPETWIDQPPTRIDSDQPLILTGRAADNFQLGRLEMLVVDLDNDLFWDSENRQWVSQRVLFDVPLQLDPADPRPGHWASWTYEFDGPQQGKLFFCPRAFDAEGNFDSSVPYQIVPLPQTGH